MKPEIVYVYDAYCGWCYGFSGVIKALEERYRDDFQFALVSGGMIVGDRVGPLAEMAAYIRGAHKRVEEMTGVKFGAAFLEGTLDDPDYISDSMVPSKAAAVFKSMDEGRAIAFAHAVQAAFYGAGKSLNEVATYVEIVTAMGLDTATFEARMAEPKYEEQARGEFRLSNQLGVQGFPALIYRDDKHLAAIARGYQSLEVLEDVFEQLKALQ